jgi:hypothetical protein
MPKLFCAQLRDRLVLRHNHLSSRSGFVLIMLLYTHDPISKIPIHILGKHCQIMFLRTFGSRRPLTALVREGGRTGGRADEQALSLANACNPLLQAHLPWAQDNTKPWFSPLCVPSRADPSGLGHAATIYSSVQGPPGVERRQLARQVGACCVLTVTTAACWCARYSFLRRATVTTAAVSPPGGGGLDDVFPPWRKSSIRVCPVTFPAAGGGGGATMAKQEAAPRRLSSGSTTPVPQRGTRRALTSRLRRRRAPFPRNTPTPSGQMTPARSRRICWALASYLR